MKISIAEFKTWLTRLTKQTHIQILSFVLLFAVVGSIITLFSHAESISTISGLVFKDMNRNGVQDGGEAPISDQTIYLYDSAGVYIKNATTDTTGKYVFPGLAPGNYKLGYAPFSWNDYQQNWVPTTFNGSLYPETTITLDAAATVDFGIREIVRSTNNANPISTYTGPTGLVVKSYDDVVTAKEVFDRLAKGLLVSGESKYVTIRFDFTQTGLTSGLAVKVNGVYTDYKAISDITYRGWLQGDGELFHEYGHAWSGYYANIAQQDATYTSYLKARGIYGDSRLNTSYAWNTEEMIAEDYRELFGTPSAQSDSQINREIPLANDVPGLRDFLKGPFMQPLIPVPPPSADTTAPTAPTNLVGKPNPTSPEGSGIDLSWTASTDNIAVSKYLITRKTSDGVQVDKVVNAPSTTFTDTGLTANTNYQYSVKAVDAAGNTSAASATITVNSQMPDTQPPTAPSGLVSPTQTNNSVTLKWNPSADNTGVVSYQIYQLGGTRKNSYSNLVATATGTTYSVTGLTKGTSYSYYIVALDAAGNQSAPSNTLTVKTKR